MRTLATSRGCVQTAANEAAAPPIHSGYVLGFPPTGLAVLGAIQVTGKAAAIGRSGRRDEKKKVDWDWSRGDHGYGVGCIQGVGLDEGRRGYTGKPKSRENEESQELWRPSCRAEPGQRGRAGGSAADGTRRKMIAAANPSCSSPKSFFLLLPRRYTPDSPLLTQHPTPSSRRRPHAKSGLVRSPPTSSLPTSFPARLPVSGPQGTRPRCQLSLDEVQESQDATGRRKKSIRRIHAHVSSWKARHSSPDCLLLLETGRTGTLLSMLGKWGHSHPSGSLKWSSPSSPRRCSVVLLAKSCYSPLNLPYPARSNASG